MDSEESVEGCSESDSVVVDSDEEEGGEVVEAEDVEGLERMVELVVRGLLCFRRRL